MTLVKLKFKIAAFLRFNPKRYPLKPPLTRTWSATFEKEVPVNIGGDLLPSESDQPRLRVSLQAEAHHAALHVCYF
jgi:hypothetical protein